ncbi:hypothetical protein Ancab_014856 [Ancistrocladus abbreviatus]
MAMVISSSDQKPRSSFRSEKRPWMLKDYLRDDFSSCSSNGFRSFPRRQCCIAVRNLLEHEVRTRSSKRLLNRRAAVASKTMFSALQRASMAVINAVKLLPFKSSTSSSSSVVVDDRKQVKKSLLPRSFSRKLFRFSLWTKSEEKDCMVEQWISSAGEKYQPLDLTNTTTSTTVMDTTTTVWTCSGSNTSNSGSKSDSWSDSEFTLEYLLASSSENDAVDKKDDEVDSRRRVGVKAGEDTMVTAATKAKWANEEEKEQFSPVSVLDLPDDHEDGSSSSPFTDKLFHLEGRRQKLMQKLRQFECLTQLEPVNLENRIAGLGHVDDESPKLSIESSLDPSHESILTSSEEEKEENDDENQRGMEQEAEHMLQVAKAKVPSTTHKFEVDNLLLDFFSENVPQMCDQKWKYSALRTAEDWLNGRYDELLLGWEVKDKRQAYIRDMERGGTWRSTDAEKEEVTLELAAEILDYLVDEFLVEFAV